MATQAEFNPLSRLERIPVWPYGNKLIVVLGLAYFFSFFDITNVAYGIPIFTKTFHASSTLGADTITSSLFGYIAGALLVSVVSDYFGRRRALLIGITLYTVGSLFTTFSPSIAWLIGWRFVVGMGIGTMIVQVSTYLGEISPAALRGRFTGLANIFSFAGLAAVPFVALWLVPSYSWGWRAMLFVGALGGLTTLVLGSSLRETPRWLMIHGRVDEATAFVDHAEEMARRKLNGSPLPPVVEISLEDAHQSFPMLELFRPPYLLRMIVLLLYFLLWYSGDYAYLGLAPTFLVKEGFGLGASIGFSAIAGIGFLVGAVLIYFYGDRFERKHFLMVTGAAGGVAIILLGLFPSPFMVALAGFIFTIAIAVLSILGYIITAEHFPTRARSSGLAMCDGVGHFGGAMGPLIALWAYAHWGFAGGFGMMGVTTLLCIVLMVFTVRATRRTLESVTVAFEPGHEHLTTEVNA